MWESKSRLPTITKRKEKKPQKTKQKYACWRELCPPRLCLPFPLPTRPWLGPRGSPGPFPQSALEAHQTGTSPLVSARLPPRCQGLDTPESPRFAVRLCHSPGPSSEWGFPSPWYAPGKDRIHASECPRKDQDPSPGTLCVNQGSSPDPQGNLGV